MRNVTKTTKATLFRGIELRPNQSKSPDVVVEIEAFQKYFQELKSLFSPFFPFSSTLFSPLNRIDKCQKNKNLSNRKVFLNENSFFRRPRRNVRKCVWQFYLSGLSNQYLHKKRKNKKNTTTKNRLKWSSTTFVGRVVSYILLQWRNWNKIFFGRCLLLQTSRTFPACKNSQISSNYSFYWDHCILEFVKTIFCFSWHWSMLKLSASYRLHGSHYSQSPPAKRKQGHSKPEWIVYWYV